MNPSLFNDGLEPKTAAFFHSLCQRLPETEVPALHLEIQNALQKMQEALSHNEFLDLTAANKIAETLTHLLMGYNRFPADQQALVVGAARYFIEKDDAEHDTDSILGLDDDIAVLNHVLDQIGYPDRKIHL